MKASTSLPASVGAIRHPVRMASPYGIPGDGDPADDSALRMASLDAWLDELDELHGPVPADATAAARRWWARARPAKTA